jgi:hypothetical protein
MRTRQRGAALILFATVLILGVAWYAVGALGKAPVASAEREIRTGLALEAGKKALLGYVAQYAARSTTAEPGQMPCPESITLANPGESSTSCSATMTVVGRLPWKTLGIDQLRDGNGEPLWYMMRGFRDAPINFGSAGQLAYNGSTVVAMVIAPGVPLNTAATAGTPAAGCTKQSQLVAERNAAPLSAANFLECGVATGSLASPGDSTWTNDRVIAITAAEWADAIAPAIADRLQRQVAPAMNDYYTTTSLASWGQRFLPNSSILNTAAATDLCGDNNQREGMPPVASVASGTCSTTWDSVSVSGLGLLLSFGSCSYFPNPASPTEVHCDFNVILGGIASPRINISAPRIGYSFRYIDTSKIMIEVNGPSIALPLVPPYPVASTGNYSGSVSATDGRGTFSFEVFFPALSILEVVRIRIPLPSDALLDDARSAWYVNNNWGRYTYYGVAQAATSDPGSSVCTPGTANVSGCLTVNGITSPNNAADDKRLVLVLMGRALAGQDWTSTDPADYLEALNSPALAADNSTVGDRQYTSTIATSTFNDRVAVCPFKYQNQAGGDIWLCNN